MTQTVSTLNEQTRADLELLLAEQDRGWCAYAPGMHSATSSTGIGGCLFEQMSRLIDAQGITGANHNHEHRERIDNMVMALGFRMYCRGKVEAGRLSMFAWNDQQTDPDVIRHRIKDALNV